MKKAGGGGQPTLKARHARAGGRRWALAVESEGGSSPEVGGSRIRSSSLTDPGGGPRRLHQNGLRLGVATVGSMVSTTKHHAIARHARRDCGIPTERAEAGLTFGTIDGYCSGIAHRHNRDGLEDPTADVTERRRWSCGGDHDPREWGGEAAEVFECAGHGGLLCRSAPGAQGQAHSDGARGRRASAVTLRARSCLRLGARSDFRPVPWQRCIPTLRG